MSGSGPAVESIADGILRWAGRHPEWHPPMPFGATVASFAFRDGRDTVLVDPLAPDDDVDGLVAELGDFLTGRVRIFVTIPYHVRSAEPLWLRLRAHHDTTIWGHPALAKRLGDRPAFRPMTAGDALAGGILPIAIGNPRRYETPLFVPEHRALVFGDAIVESGGVLRVWIQMPMTEKRRAWYDSRLRPSLLPLLDVDADRVLVTHGESVLSGGAASLRAAIAGEPWYHRPT